MARFAVLLACFLALPALALAAGTDPVKRISQADQRKAATIILERTDLVAGWKQVSVAPNDMSDLGCPSFDPDASDLTVTGEAKATFKTDEGIRSVYSGSSVYGTNADALAFWSRNVTSGLVRCLAHTLRQGMAKENGTVTIVSKGRIAFPQVAPRTAAFRVATRVSVTQAGQKVTLPFTLHWVGLGRGRAVTAFVALGVGKGLPTQTLNAYAKLLASRLAAAKT